LLQLRNNNGNKYSCGRPLSFENFNNSEEQIVEICTSLMPIIRGTINIEADNEQNTPEKNGKKNK
jgi:hypothetical protein